MHYIAKTQGKENDYDNNNQGIKNQIKIFKTFLVNTHEFRQEGHNNAAYNAARKPAEPPDYCHGHEICRLHGGSKRFGRQEAYKMREQRSRKTRQSGAEDKGKAFHTA